MLILFRYLIIILVALHFIDHIITYIKEDETFSEIVSTLLICGIYGYAIYWMLSTVYKF
jgi:uncharacterized membrane-anchored protein